MQGKVCPVVRPGMWIAVLAAYLLCACGGGGRSSGVNEATPGGTTAASAPTASIATGQPLITLSSDAGDSIGGGGNYAYDTTNAAIRVSVLGSHLSVQVDGREHWMGDFQLPGNLSQLQPGTFASLTRYPFQANGSGALAWSGQGHGCNTLTGSVVVNSVNYQAGVLESIDLSFEQHCEGAAAALRGQIRIGAGAMAQLAVPQNPAPAHPEVALSSDAGDYIGGGGVYAYDNGNAVVTVAAAGPHLTVHVAGDQQWTADLLLPSGFAELTPGTYAGLTRYPFQAAGAGALNWSGEGRGCNTLIGSMVINSVRYDAGVLSAIDMTFEQRCDGGIPALKGAVHWDASIATPPAGPLNPPPDGLWTPPANAMSATGNAMYLSSAPGDYIGQGWTWWVGAVAGSGSGASSGTAVVSISESNGLLKVNLTGDETWVGEFKAMNSLGHLQIGYYGILKRYPFQNPTRGGMDWSMDGRGCNALSGWFAVDSISYQGAQLQAVDLRFTQYCENSIAPLRGRIRWNLGVASN